MFIFSLAFAYIYNIHCIAVTRVQFSAIEYMQWYRSQWSWMPQLWQLQQRQTESNVLTLLLLLLRLLYLSVCFVVCVWVSWALFLCCYFAFSDSRLHRRSSHICATTRFNGSEFMQTVYQWCSVIKCYPWNERN